MRSHRSCVEGSIVAMWETLLGSAIAADIGNDAGEASFELDAGQVIHRVSPSLDGGCIEVVNHESYGGLSGQMIFGEGFQESPRPRPIRGSTAHGGRWQVRKRGLRADPGECGRSEGLPVLRDVAEGPIDRGSPPIGASSWLSDS
jgi:hypothetical protein